MKKKRDNTFLKTIFRFGIVTILCIALLVSYVIAYSFSAITRPYEDPQTVSVYISSNMPHINDVVDAYDNWNSLSQCYTYRSYNINYTEAYFVYSDISTGAYASTSPIGNSDWKQVTCRPLWVISLNSSQRQEVIAHEMGHCWGLGHGAANSLMRATGFNGNVCLASKNSYTFYDFGNLIFPHPSPLFTSS